MRPSLRGRLLLGSLAAVGLLLVALLVVRGREPSAAPLEPAHPEPVAAEAPPPSALAPAHEAPAPEAPPAAAGRVSAEPLLPGAPQPTEGSPPWLEWHFTRHDDPTEAPMAELHGSVFLRPDTSQHIRLSVPIEAGIARLQSPPLPTFDGWGPGSWVHLLTVDGPGGEGAYDILGPRHFPMDGSRIAIPLRPAQAWTVAVRAEDGHPPFVGEAVLHIDGSDRDGTPWALVPGLAAHFVDSKPAGEPFVIPPPPRRDAVLWFGAPGFSWKRVPWAQRHQEGDEIRLEPLAELVFELPPAAEHRELDVELLPANPQWRDRPAMRTKSTPATGHRLVIPPGRHHVRARWAGTGSEGVLHSATHDVAPADSLRIRIGDEPLRAALTVLVKGEAGVNSTQQILHGTGLRGEGPALHPIGPPDERLREDGALRLTWHALPAGYYALQIDGNECAVLRWDPGHGEAPHSIEFGPRRTRHVHLHEREWLEPSGEPPGPPRLVLVAIIAGKLPEEPIGGLPLAKHEGPFGRQVNFAAPDGALARISYWDQRIESGMLELGGHTTLELHAKPGWTVLTGTFLPHLPRSWAAGLRASHSAGGGVPSGEVSYGFEQGNVRWFGLQANAPTRIFLPGAPTAPFEPGWYELPAGGGVLTLERLLRFPAGSPY